MVFPSVLLVVVLVLAIVHWWTLRRRILALQTLLAAERVETARLRADVRRLTDRLADITAGRIVEAQSRTSTRRGELVYLVSGAAGDKVPIGLLQHTSQDHSDQLRSDADELGER